MRSSCSESLRLRSARSVCSARRPEICRVMYHDIGHDGGQRDDQAEQQRRRRRSSFCSSARAHHHDRLRASFPQPDDVVGGGRFAAELAQPRRVLAAVIMAVHGALRERLGDRDA